MSATIYLAGPVAAYRDGGAAWRQEVMDYWGDEYDFRNPLAKYNVNAEQLDLVDGYSNPENPGTVGIDELVEQDLEWIDESDGILVGYTMVPSIGTPMEVMYARERDMPVAIWIRDETDFDNLSPWYRYHATALTTDPEMGLRHIERQAEEKEIVTDGGTYTHADRPDPADDPTLCSLCGVYLGSFPNSEYCDPCARDIGVKPPFRRCVECGQEGPEERMVAIDVSRPDEYYPTFEYLCRGCSDGGAGSLSEGDDL